MLPKARSPDWSWDEAHFARKIDTRLVPPIQNMVNEGTDQDIQGDDQASVIVRKLLRGLAVRTCCVATC